MTPAPEAGRAAITADRMSAIGTAFAPDAMIYFPQTCTTTPPALKGWEHHPLGRGNKSSKMMAGRKKPGEGDCLDNTCVGR
jgi:hypothetical protein